MDIQRAADILEINLLDITNLSIIKKQYHKLAILHHPDKNTDKNNSHEKFVLINQAYEYLKKFSNKEVFDEPPNEMNMSYVNLLNIFIQSIFKDTKYEVVINIIHEIVIDCKKISVKLFEGLDKYVCVELYEFICKYKIILHIASNIIEEIKEAILLKFKDDQLFILNPSIDDLFEGNVYKLIVHEKTYYVPLWHNELYYDGSGCEIIIKCIPELPENIQILDNNNILFNLFIPLNNELLLKSCIQVHLGKKTFQIQLDNLYVKKKQYITFKHQGICQINETDIYNILKKSDVIIFCEFI